MSGTDTVRARDGAIVWVAGLGPAYRCCGYGEAVYGATNHRPVPLRFIWHHVQPLNAGGQTVKENLIELCDSCHYAVHALLYYAAKHGGVLPAGIGSQHQRELASRGFMACRDAGTLGQVTNEGSVL